MEDGKIVEKILRTLLESYNYIVCSIEESKAIDTMYVDELQSSLLVHQQKLKRHSVEEQALKITYDWDMREEDQGRGRRRPRRGQGRGRAINRAIIECWRCHKLGHFQGECPGIGHYATYTDLHEG